MYIIYAELQRENFINVIGGQQWFKRAILMNMRCKYLLFF